MKHIYVLSLILLSIGLKGQVIFQHEYLKNGFNCIPSSIMEYNEDTLLLLHSKNQLADNELYNYQCAILDKNGKYLDSISYNFDETAGFYRLLKFQDKKIIIGNLYQSIENFKLAIFEITDSLTLIAHTYDSIENVIPTNPKIFEINKRIILTYGAQNPFSTKRELCFIELNNNLEVIKSQHFENIHINDIIYNSKDAVFYINGTYDSALSQITIDPNFNIINIFNTPFSTPVNHIEFVNDNIYEFGRDFDDKMKLRLINKQNEEIDCIEFGQDTMMCIAELSSITKGNDGYYYTFSSTFDYGNFPISEEPNYLHVAQIDSNMTVIWEKRIGDDKHAYYPMEISPASDSGVYLLATVYKPESNPLNLDMVFIKLGAKGVVDTTSYIQNAFKIGSNIFPNPGNEYLSIKSNFQSISYDFLLYTQYGQLILQKNDLIGERTVSTKHLNSGIYIYELRINKQVIKKGKWVKQ